MTKRLLKTRRDHRQMRAVMNENTVTQTMTPNAGALAQGTVATPITPINFALSAPVGTSRFSIASGTLPAGLSLSSAGVLSGTPTAAVVAAAFSIRGTDEFGNSKVNAYTMTVVV